MDTPMDRAVPDTMRTPGRSDWAQHHTYSWPPTANSVARACSTDRMDRHAVLTTFDAQLRNTVHRTAEGRYERVGPVIRCVTENPGDWSWIEWSDLNESNADQVISEQLAYFGDRLLEWKYYTHDQP